MRKVVPISPDDENHQWELSQLDAQFKEINACAKRARRFLSEVAEGKREATRQQLIAARILVAAKRQGDRTVSLAKECRSMDRVAVILDERFWS